MVPSGRRRGAPDSSRRTVRLSPPGAGATSSSAATLAILRPGGSSPLPPDGRRARAAGAAPGGGTGQDEADEAAQAGPGRPVAVRVAGRDRGLLRDPLQAPAVDARRAHAADQVDGA